MRLRLFVAVMLFAAGAVAWPPWGNRPGWNTSDSWHGGLNTVRPIFDLDFSDGSGPSLLPATLTLNSTTETADVYCLGSQLSGSNLSCTHGGTFVTHRAGGTLTSSPAPFTETAARGLTFSGGDDSTQIHIDAPDTSVGNAGTEDLVVEIVLRNMSSTSSILGKDDGTNGWVFETGGNDIRARLRGAASSIDSVAATALPANQWGHVIWFVNRDENSTNGQRLFVNGALADSDNPSTKSASIDNTQTMTIGADHASAASGVCFTCSIAQVAVWTRADWIAAGASGATDMAAVAAERASRVMGTFADVAAGQAYPTTTTRATVGMVDIDRDGDGVRRLFLTSAGWMRVVRAPDSGSTLRNGFLGEEARTNSVLQSQAFDNASWTKTSMSTPTANTAVSPTQFTDAEGLDAADAAGDVAHHVSQSVTTTAASWTISGFFKVGSQSAILVRNGTANHGSCFNISTCAVIGTYEGSPTSRAESFGDGWCRISMTHTATAASNSFNFYVSDDTDSCGVGDETYDDGTNSVVDMYMWGAQIELGSGVSSYIVTTTATSTRNADTLLYSPTSNVYSTLGTDEIQFFCRGGTTGATRLFYASDGANNNIGHPDTGTNLNFYYRTGGAAQAAIGTSMSGINDGTLRTLRGYWSTNDARAWLNGAADGTDASVTTFADGTATRIAILNNGAASPSALNTCIMTRARIWNKLVTP